MEGVVNNFALSIFIWDGKRKMAGVSRRKSLNFPSILTALSIHLTIIAGEYFTPFNVTYDHRALIIAGKRRILISAGIHYPRATPEMWPKLIARSKEGGADVIETYTFWNGQEPTRGQYNFEGRYDIVKFAKLVGSHGLYLFLRIAPSTTHKQLELPYCYIWAN
ncbi:hypothetical protein P3L10_010743 [Capsicum annuum]